MHAIFQTFSIVPFHNDFPLAVSSPNTVYYIMSSNNQLPVAQQYFTNISVTQNMGVLQV